MKMNRRTLLEQKLSTVWPKVQRGQQSKDNLWTTGTQSTPITTFLIEKQMAERSHILFY